MEKIPEIGFGTFRLKRESVKQPLRDAIGVGYRHIDTAGIYQNETEIGQLLKELYTEKTITRSDIWITSKLSPYDMETPRAALLKSLSSLQTDYLDLYLIHWPAVSRTPGNSPLHKKLRLEAWNVLNEAKQQGLLRNVGVSNFTPHHIQELRDETTYGIDGMHVQMEIHPWYWRDGFAIQNMFREHGIVMTGYALLAEGKLLGEPCPEALIEIASRTEVTSVQVVLAWALFKGWNVLVKSENPSHLVQNLGAGRVAAMLTPEEIAGIDTISQKVKELKECWDPRAVT
ncbi:NAD(P)-linked oxidoreductase [Glarea lozoyensis ATCC 20868]|uniref:NAD(P)-linked oxidoreductase n=1 Tax=Glarea lozoyensis (strain ATCC 20868 / MF5171) TaxID=1116229 RepID=S3D9H2_GLAL2|nr:NAD(P)-linked oxidoreductase [Glarea lozoyensis ATCC 20868]EPE34370.1 NAD(P)-linked oxidoreductase [Glarea lozoyensis ATCC 20868]